jgi:hypothetical protein
MPYIGYFQLIHSVDEFIVYDNIQYTKKGWINRNRILTNERDRLFTLPIKKDSDYLNVVDRKLAESWKEDRKKLTNLIEASYNKAPYFYDAFPLVSQCLNWADHSNLFNFILNSLTLINNHLDIKTNVVISSAVDINHNLKSQDKVLALCKARTATHYINAIGGTSLYDKKTFIQNNIELNFIKSNPITYKQSNNKFVPWLSIIDVLMFNSKQQIQQYLNEYTLL